jgi:CheY-like chemotaxis protein
VDEVTKAAERAAGLTRQLLAFSRKQVLQPRVLDLNGTVAGLERMLRRLIGEDVVLTIRLDPALERVRADPGQMEQVLMNLVVNARDAMPRGGHLAVETANAVVDEAFARTHADLLEGRYVRLRVQDEGEGMDRETLARIFEPFFTTKEKGKGTGLGLSMVYGIVRQSGGGVWASSEPGAGSTFDIYLPVCADAPEAAAAAPAPPPEALRGSETVLVVEDDEMVRHLAVQILIAGGYQVLEAANAGEALLLAETHPSKIDLMLTDVVMPRVSGRQLADRVARLRPGMKVVFMSGYTEDAVLLHGVSEATVSFVQKPITPDALGREVRRVLDELR